MTWQWFWIGWAAGIAFQYAGSVAISMLLVAAERRRQREFARKVEGIRTELRALKARPGASVLAPERASGVQSEP